MKTGRLLFAPLLLGALALVAPLPASMSSSVGGGSQAWAKGSSKSASKKSTSKKSNKKASKKRRSKKSKRRGKKSYYRGHGVAKSSLRTEPLEKPSGDVWLYAANFREEIKVNIYKKSGELNEAALADLDKLFRCKRTKEVRAVDPRLYVTLSRIADHFGQKRIELVSGFRFQRNEGSRHFHASAMDIRIPGVSNREMYEYAESLDAGGMGIGIYPRSGFVHVDFRAPGDNSYRWTDNSPPDGNAAQKRPSRRWRSKRPSS